MHAEKQKLEESILKVNDDENSPFLADAEKAPGILPIKLIGLGPKKEDKELSKINKVVLLGLALLIMIVVFSLLYNFFLTSQSVLDTRIKKSKLDSRLYKAIVLPNDMKVLLISDEEAETAGVALNVAVGSWDEPQEFPGLAHFLEHMLFMGSEKYPNINEFNNFISANGGSFNAFTAEENTNYHFTIFSDALEKGIDIFSRFFIDPLLAPSSVNGEVNAVNSEYQNDIADPKWKIEFMMKMLARPEHPFGKFNIGNLDSLKFNPERMKKNTYEELMNFYIKSYSANLMSLVILGKQSIEVLEDWARSKFVYVKNKHKERSRKYETNPFPKENLGVLAKFQSLSEKKALNIIFPLPEILSKFEEKPLGYLTYILDYGGKNSLETSLKNKGLIMNLDVGDFTKTSAFTNFGFELILTDKGASSVESILEEVFAYIRLVAREGIRDDLYEDLRKISKLNFQYKEKSSQVLDEVMSLATNVGQYPVKEILRGGYLYKNFDSSLIGRYISQMTPSNAVFILSDKSYVNASSSKENKGTTPNKDFIYSRDLSLYSDLYKLVYDWAPLSPELLKNLSSIDVSKFAHLKIVGKNGFIPERLDLIDKCPDNTGNASRPNQTFECLSAWPDGSYNPETVEGTKDSLVLYKFDTSFQQPKFAMYLAVDSVISHKNARNAVLTSLLGNYLTLVLSEEFQDSKNVGSKIEVNPNIKGLEFVLQGYSDTMPKLIDGIYQKLNSTNIEPERFNLVKEDKMGSLKDMIKDTLYRQGFAMVKKVLRTFYYQPIEMFEALGNISLSDLENFKKEFFSKVRIQSLFLGNLLNTTARDLVLNIKRTMGLAEDSSMQKEFKENITKIKEKALVFRFQNQNEKDNNNLALNYYQLGYHSLENFTKLWLLENTLNNEAFSYLRSELQLGYIAFGSMSSSAHVDGFVYVVQGVEKTPDVFNRHIEELIFRMEQKLANMTKEEFEALKTSALALLREKEKNIEGKAQNYWDELREDLGEIGKKKKMAELIEGFTLSSLTQFYKYFFATVGGKLSIQIFNQQVMNSTTNNTVLSSLYPLMNSSQTYSKRNETLVENLAALKNLEKYSAPLS